jgi:hypothetical protein
MKIINEEETKKNFFFVEVDKQSERLLQHLPTIPSREQSHKEA